MGSALPTPTKKKVSREAVPSIRRFRAMRPTMLNRRNSWSLFHAACHVGRVCLVLAEKGELRTCSSQIL